MNTDSKNLKPGTWVKIRRETDDDFVELFWVIITQQMKPWLEGVVDNDLLGSRYSYGTKIIFSEKDILAIARSRADLIPIP